MAAQKQQQQQPSPQQGAIDTQLSNSGQSKHPPVYTQYPSTISLRSVSEVESDGAGTRLKDLCEDFTPKQFETVWMNYAKKEVARLPRLSNLLSSQIPQKDDSGKYLFIVSSQTISDYIYKNIHHSLESYLQTNLRNSTVRLRFVVEGEANNDSSLPYTAKEKCEYMLEKNPDLQLLMNVFKLETS